ncbi:MAG: STAS domain-containing protein [Steroidobacteraceae bacterium]
MTEAPSITQTAPDHFAVRGPLTFATARRALTGGLEAFASSPGPIEVDCSGIAASDSAGLAVLIEWLGWARRARRELRYASVPATLGAIARISEMDGLLFGR